MTAGAACHARLAQSVERWTLNPTVVGSSPTLGVLFVHFASAEVCPEYMRFRDLYSSRRAAPAYTSLESDQT